MPMRRMRKLNQTAKRVPNAFHLVGSENENLPRRKSRSCKFVRAAQYVSSDLGIVMRSSILRSAALLLSLPAWVFADNSVVNLSHYDMMRPDFVQCEIGRAADARAGKLLVVARKLQQSAASHITMERLGHVAVLRRWPLQASAVRLSEKHRECDQSRTQYLSRDPECAGEFLAGTLLEPRRKISRTGTNARGRVVRRASRRVAFRRVPSVAGNSAPDVFEFRAAL